MRSFQCTVRWCGRMISVDGMRHNIKLLNRLLNMKLYATVGQLQQILCAMIRLRLSIIGFQAMVSMSYDFMEMV